MIFVFLLSKCLGANACQELGALWVKESIATWPPQAQTAVPGDPLNWPLSL